MKRYRDKVHVQIFKIMIHQDVKLVGGEDVELRDAKMKVEE